MAKIQHWLFQVDRMIHLQRFEWKLYCFVLIWMSSNFLQRFKGKTQTLSKQGVHTILGTKNVAPTNLPNQPSKEQNTSAHKAKSSLPQNVTSNQINQTKNKASKQSQQQQMPQQNSVAVKATRTENPFLVANPFYLDQEQRQRQQLQRRQRIKIQQQTRKALLAQKDQKQITKTSNYSKSVDKKNNSNGKQWVRLGGLGANIGGDDWMQKRKKLEKMQQFAGQVKSINAQKIKPRPDIPKPRQKQVNSRQKALDYSKNVPKPALKKSEEQQQMIEEKVEREPNQGLTELQIYEMKHQQLKKMINNHY